MQEVKSAQVLLVACKLTCVAFLLLGIMVPYIFSRYMVFFFSLSHWFLTVVQCHVISHRHYCNFGTCCLVNDQTKK